MRAPVRVLVLEPLAPRRQRMQRWLQDDTTLHVVGAVSTVAQALDAAARRQPEVVLLGQGHAPEETVRFTRAIMQARATPIVVVTAASTPVEERQAFALVEAGALAVLHDPGPESAAQHGTALQNLLTTVRLMAEVKVVRRWASHAAAPLPPATNPAPAAPGRSTAAPRMPALTAMPGARIELVAIGASTGGPVALQQLLCALPADFPVPIVIVQHMADGFLHGMAEWLSVACAVQAQLAAPGVPLQPGRAYIAPDGIHIVAGSRGELQFDAGPPCNGHRPSVSRLFASVAAHYGAHAIGVLLTGMGKDGAAELKRMREAGAITIAQDEASSVVHGMPGEAIRCGGASYVMSPQEIGAALAALVPP